MPVLQESMSTLTQVYAQGNLKNDVVIIQVSQPWEFQHNPGIKFWELVLEKQRKNILRFKIRTHIEILQIDFQVGLEMFMGFRDSGIAQGYQQGWFQYDPEAFAQDKFVTPV